MRIWLILFLLDTIKVKKNWPLSKLKELRTNLISIEGSINSKRYDLATYIQEKENH